MKRIWRHLIAAFLPLFPASSWGAEGRGYAGAQAGMFLPIESSVHGDVVGEDATVTYNPGFVVAAVGGYRFANGLRGEGEFSYRQLTTDRLINSAGDFRAYSDVWSYAFMTNLYYDFRNQTVVTPYVGAGIGMAVTKFGTGRANDNVVWNSDDYLSVAYQAIAGFELRLSDSTSLDFVYHHFAVPRLHFETLSSQFRGINLSVGIRQWF